MSDHYICGRAPCLFPNCDCSPGPDGQRMQLNNTPPAYTEKAGYEAGLRNAALEEAARRVETAPESLRLMGPLAYAEHIRALKYLPPTGAK